MKVLCAEPYYPRSEPPIGLMKLATFHKENGNEIRAIRGTDPFGAVLGSWAPDQIDITTPIFSWYTAEGVETVRFYRERFPDAYIRVGGVKATDTPEVYDIDGIELVRGVDPIVDEYAPDYELFGVKHSIVYTMRGCKMKCGFCRVWRGFGKDGKPLSVPYPLMNWRSHFRKEATKATIQDDNIVALGTEHLREVVRFLQPLKLTETDINSGFETHQFTEEHAEVLSGIKRMLRPVRTAFDELKEETEAVRTIGLIRKHIQPDERKIICYCLFNYLETPEECLYRANRIIEAGASPYVMAFVPNTWTKGDLRRGQAWISEKYGWTLPKAKAFKRFFDRWWIWRSVLKNNGKITERDIYGGIAA